MKRIIVTFNKKTGGVTIKTEGYKGAACLEATRELERRLGIEDTAQREMTPAYHITENQQEVQS